MNVLNSFVSEKVSLRVTGCRIADIDQRRKTRINRSRDANETLHLRIWNTSRTPGVYERIKGKENRAIAYSRMVGASAEGEAATREENPVT